MGARFQNQEVMQAAFDALLREIPDECQQETLAEMRAVASRYLPGASAQRAQAVCLSVDDDEAPMTGGQIIIAGATRRALC